MAVPRKPLTLALRLWTLATRFVLIFFLARYLPVADVGVYGLLVATVGYVVYILGMDMYTFTTREVIKAPQNRWHGLVRSHLVFLLVVYVIVLPALLLLFAWGLLPWHLLLWFYLLAVTEHLAIEIDRLLVAMSEQFSASIVVFVRQALLPTIVVPLVICWPPARHVEVVLAIWAIFNVIAITIGAVFVRRNIRGGSPSSTDWTWIRRGFKLSLLFLAGSLCLRVLFAADRQVVAAIDGLEVLGAYTFAVSVGTGLSNALNVVVHQFGYPKLVKAAHDQDRAALGRELRTMSYQTAAIAAMAALGVLLVQDFIVAWVGGGIYAQYQWLLIASIGVYALYNASLIPHYGLYALHADRFILLTTALSLVAFGIVVACALAVHATAVSAVLLGLTASSALLLVTKLVGYLRLLDQRIPKELTPHHV